MAAARAGDRQALGHLLEAHYDRVYALCRRMTGNEADALDAAQDAMLAAVRSLGRFDGRSTFATWLYRVATNACLDELRRRRRRPWLARADDPQPDPPVADPAGSVADRVDLDRALAAVPPAFRAAVVLRDVCDLSYEEVAAVLDVPVGTVRSRLARGRGALADALGAAAGNEPAPSGVQDSMPPEGP